MFLLITILVPALMMALAVNVVYLLVRIFTLPWHIHIAYGPFAWTAVGLLTLWGALILYGNLIGRFRSETKTWEFVHKEIPEAFDGYRIVHISDLHLDSWKGHEKQLAKQMAAVNSLKPDLICFTGDLVSMSPSEAEPFLEILRMLKAKDGIISVLGNHDYLPYSRDTQVRREEQLKDVIRIERELLGWQLLMNENTTIRRGGDTLAILGCENQSVGAHSVVKRGNLEKAAEGTEGMMRILLTHDPSQWRKEVLGKTDIPLTLCGHTHAMQMRIFGWTLSKYLYPECDGLYSENGQSLYVNIGLGGTAPFRIGATPEITLMTLRTIL